MSITKDPSRKTDYVGIIVIIFIIGVVIFAAWVCYDAYQYRITEDSKWTSHCELEAKLSVYHPNQWTTEKFNEPIDVCQVKLFEYNNGTSSTSYVRYSDDYRTQFNKVSIETQLDCNGVSFDNKTGQFICPSGKIASEVDNFR